MKKLTWLFLSLMLFLGMGTAFAQDGEGEGPATPTTVPTPTFTPNSGTVAPGSEIVFDLPQGFDNPALMVLVLYTFDATATFGSFTYDYIDGLMEEMGAPASLTGINTSMYMAGGIGGFSDGEEEGPAGGWAPAVQIPSDAQGSVTMRAHMVVINPDESVIASDMVTANYTVDGSVAPTQPTVLDITPVFNPASGSAVKEGSRINVSIGEEYSSEDYWMYYVIDDENFDFSQYTNEDDIADSDAKESATGNIKIDKACKVTVAVCKVEFSMSTYRSEFTAWSTPVTATYTIEEPEPENNVPMPVFNPNGGAVPSGTKILLTNGTESDATAKPIYYNYKGADAAVDVFKGFKTKKELDDEIAKSYSAESLRKINLYAAPGITLTAGKTISAATADIDADGNVTWSTIVTKVFTIGEAPVPGGETPTAPVFSPDGGEIEAEAAITMSTSCASCKIYYSEYIDDFVSYKTQDELAAAANANVAMVHEYSNGNKPTLGDLNVTTPGTMLSLSAASAAFDANGNITWSEATTRNFTVKAGEEPVVAVAAPVITPANDAQVRMGREITITCATEGAEIWYTTDGTAPFNMDKDGYPVSVKDGALKYTEPFELTEDMLIKQGTVWALKIRAVATKGESISTGASAGYVVYPNAPEFSPEAGEVEKGTKVTISCVPSQSVIYYTTDGTTPTMENSPEYTEPIEITETMTLKAVVVLGQYQASGSAAYTVKEEEPVVEPVAAPVFSIAAGQVKRGTEVSMACETEGAVIYYTVDGSEPTALSTPYETAIVINEDVTLKAIAIKGEAKSEVVTAAYTIDVTANEDLELAGVTVYPNPSNGVFNLELPVAATVEVFMSNGVLYQRLSLNEGNTTLNINRSGIYFLRITGEGRTAIKRVIVR